MMEQALSAVPKEGPIPRDTRTRLYELAWAIVYAGDAGKSYANLVHAIMERKVESWAPPFGMVAIHPKRLCEALKRIEGEASLRSYAFCVDEKVPFEQ